MSLQSRLAALITQIGADIKALQAKTPTILNRTTSLSDAEQPLFATEWRDGGSGGSLIAKLAGINPVIASVISNRSELWTRVKSRDGTLSQDRLVLDSDGKSDFLPLVVTALPTTSPSGGALYDGQECYYLADATNNVVWHLKYKTSTAKWHYVGGPPLYAETTNQDSTGSTGAYIALGNAGPSIPIPLAGTYMVSQGAVHNSNTASANSYMSYDIGATGAVDADGIFWQNSTALNAYTPGTRTRRKTLTAVTLTSKYKASAGFSTFRDRWMSVLPVTVG
jgi:hypothetical protein